MVREKIMNKEKLIKFLIDLTEKENTKLKSDVKILKSKLKKIKKEYEEQEKAFDDLLKKL
ncbi:hypothetical protein MBIO_0007 [Mycoplasmopsis fermentans PG18]|uniref:Uncharacterized protein n=2 Tax=Mycoplasmopsis fermentans TaxID=2115 RepID=C4XDQ0_MYCFP|nr:hypothetical protein MBIO_0007 [Mycoplasmopsis fermentans PG18]